MNEELVANLEDLGLSEKEARVYLANLSLGPATVQNIADHAGIKRVTAYVILESLVNLGLASQSNKGKKTFFNAEEPISLKRLLQKKEQELKDQKVNFDNVLPDLERIKSLPTDSPSVKFYDSREGIKSIIKTFYDSHMGEGIDTVYGISNLDQLYEFFPEFKDASSNPSRVAARVKSKIIYTSVNGPSFARSDEKLMREALFVPLDRYPISGDITIVGNHFLLLSLKGAQPIGITVYSEQLAKGMLAIFNLAWEAAEKLDK